MKEFNPKTASLRTFYRKIDEFWQNKSPNKPYTFNDLTNEFNLSNRWRYETYKSEKIVPLLEKQLEKELNLNNQQPIVVNLQTDIRDIKKESDNNA